jgi:hypothetical protein
MGVHRFSRTGPGKECASGGASAQWFRRRGWRFAVAGRFIPGCFETAPEIGTGAAKRLLETCQQDHRSSYASRRFADFARRSERDQPRCGQQCQWRENYSPGFRKKVFLASLHRLAHGRWFSPRLIVQGLDAAKARTHLAAPGYGFL